MLEAWIVAGIVALLVGILVAGWMRGPNKPTAFASQMPSATAAPSSPPPPSPSGRPAATAVASESATSGTTATPSAAVTVQATTSPAPPGPTASPVQTPVPPAPTSTPGPAVLLALGDTASCDDDTDSAVAALAASLPGSIALLGDLAYPDGSAHDFANCFDPVWGTMRARLRPAVGNHEYETSGASGYFEYFGSDAGEPGQGWYAYDAGAWRVLVLNSNCDQVGGCSAGSPQYSWLKAQLAHAPACTLAYWHHPRYSSGMHGNNDVMADVWSTLAASGVDLVLAGHDHDYERVRANGLREFVVGTGGRSLYAFSNPPSSTTEFRRDDTYGLLRLDLASGSYAWHFIPAAGGTFSDSGTAPCR